MRMQAILCAAVLGTLALAASAQGNDRRDADVQRGAHGPQPVVQHTDDRRGPDREMGNRGEREREYSARNWHKGDRVPPEYRDRQHVVNNWREHHLSAPPRGYEWVQVGGDYVLISAGTGVIAQLTLAR